MKMSSGFHSTMKVPGNRVGNALLNVNLTDWTLPSLSLFGIGTGALLDLKLHTALNLRVRQSGTNH
jgi:hypothetical protein